MQVESIGGVATSQNNAVTNNSAISQEEFIKLFLAQLNYQDPLEPVDNSEFLAQLAQFSSLEQSRQMNDNIVGLLSMNSSNQALTLLGKSVQVTTQTGASFTGTVQAVSYSAGAPSLTVRNADGSFIDRITLSQIKLVQDN
ncbi:flagellar hook assembly protein FlgD [Rheinheimera aquimaris]|jgi:flagellar basal-body rod modification protein FlgD|uniref:flagellar hook assembly protein FlgD n=1 Tax=Rheinheimera aquimaris TaxID=412437 RepID=UPI001066E971|nr:flagellar hook capping FlgD N-terminal domain-containing protein [Rheinheimera aquimaris]|tara:strand:+ start:15990 stop:16412 length:423 start_codon:yes stop_codon:yes gene_type:complete